MFLQRLSASTPITQQTEQSLQVLVVLAGEVWLLEKGTNKCMQSLKAGSCLVAEGRHGMSESKGSLQVGKWLAAEVLVLRKHVFMSAIRSWAATQAVAASKSLQGIIDSFHHVHKRQQVTEVKQQHSRTAEEAPPAQEQLNSNNASSFSFCGSTSSLAKVTSSTHAAGAAEIPAAAGTGTAATVTSGTARDNSSNLAAAGGHDSNACDAVLDTASGSSYQVDPISNSSSSTYDYASLWAGVPSSVRQTLLSGCTCRRLKQGQAVVVEGTIAESVVVVLNGKLMMIKQAGQDKFHAFDSAATESGEAVGVAGGSSSDTNGPRPGSGASTPNTRLAGLPGIGISPFPGTTQTVANGMVTDAGMPGSNHASNNNSAATTPRSVAWRGASKSMFDPPTASSSMTDMGAGELNKSLGKRYVTVPFGQQCFDELKLLGIILFVDGCAG